MNLPRLLTFLLCACGLALAGCNSSAKLGEITVALVDIKPASATLLESQAVLTLRFFNENIVPFALSGSTHKLYLNGSYVGKAVSNEPLGLQPASTATRDVTVMLENLALVRQLLAMRGQGTIEYRLENVLFTSTYEDDKIQLRSETKGSLDLSSLSSLGQ